MSSTLALSLQPEPLTAVLLLSLRVAALRELALGATLALGLLVAVAVAVCSFAGRLVDMQIGFGIAQVFDPQSQHTIPLLSGLFNQLAIAAFFALDGAHLLLRGLAASVRAFLPGQAWPLSAGAVMIVKQAGGRFAWGFALVAPVVLCLLIAELALGLLKFNAPSQPSALQQTQDDCRRGR